MSHGAGHGLIEGENRKIAILISILALFLAIAETLGKSAQTDAISYNVEAANLWAFFQAKTIRKTTMETAAEQMEVDLKLGQGPGDEGASGKTHPGLATARSALRSPSPSPTARARAARS